MTDKTPDQKQKKEFVVRMTENIENGVFANAVSVHFNGNECTLDMGLTLPAAEKATIKIVSRTHMTHKTAESLLKLLSNAILDYKNKTEKKAE